MQHTAWTPPPPDVAMKLAREAISKGAWRVVDGWIGPRDRVSFGMVGYARQSRRRTKLRDMILDHIALDVATAIRTVVAEERAKILHAELPKREQLIEKWGNSVDRLILAEHRAKLLDEKSRAVLEANANDMRPAMVELRNAVYTGE